ncbi:D-2-hydroxyacid dehydrogenase [Vibrio aphrogenes]|uniref:D-2-hydroxyacid dehydrogenase n=1 Tax=Vibrio aphrogenes TaxID=1891186 RepID=UPI000B354FBB|nr:D-2-hydroxyacid dehydrogenase [Vibrio aphrogenes]
MILDTTERTPTWVYILSKQADIYQKMWASGHFPGMKRTQDKSQATVVLADPPLLAQHIDEFPHLQWAQSTFAGVETLTQPHCPTHYQLTNVKGIFGQLISEYVLAYSLGYYRHFPQYQQQQQQRQWQPHHYQSVLGKTVVILGTGSIGNKLATTVTALGFQAIGVNRRGQLPAHSDFKHVYAIEQIDQALAQADIIVNALPSTEQTRNILNANHLSHCQQALLFNIGRGDALDESGLLLALEKHWIAHAYLDVFPVEPLPNESPYWEHPNITLTPHIAATSFPEQVFAIFEQNCQRWSAKQPLINLVDFERGY